MVTNEQLLRAYTEGCSEAAFHEVGAAAFEFGLSDCPPHGRATGIGSGHGPSGPYLPGPQGWFAPQIEPLPGWLYRGASDQAAKCRSRNYFA